MAAPKKNLYALGNNGGRPRHFESPEEMEAQIIAFFDECIKDKEHPTITGLSLFLGFSSLTSLWDYRQRNEEFSKIINRARLAVAKAYENNLDSFKYGGAIFALCNIDSDNWKNSKDITTGGEKINQNIDLSKLSDETIEAIERDLIRSRKGGEV